MAHSVETVSRGIRGAYEAYGVKGYYQEQGSAYYNPHEPIILPLLTLVYETCGPFGSRVLDLACGSGEVTLALESLGITDVVGADPYTFEAFERRTGRRSERWSFESIAAGCLQGHCFDLIICSFALHLVPVSRLPQLLYQLSCASSRLIVLTPHKRPEIPAKWHWHLQKEFYFQRVRARLYRSVGASEN